MRVVVGHHPHVTQPWERYGEGVRGGEDAQAEYDRERPEDWQTGHLAHHSFLIAVATLIIETA
jgi:hypothetical protein